MLSLTMMCASFMLTAADATAANRMPRLAFEKYTLPNGLDVILHEDHSSPLVAVNVWYHAGSKNERPGRTGFAHLFEHMMFQGSAHYDKSYFQPLQQAGGKLNGSTATDRTNYWETVPANYLELALWLESDRMGFLLPAMTQAKLDNQRDVVKNERRQSYENRPYGLVMETILAAMYPVDHPYSWPTIGSMTDLNGASRQDIARFFRRYYHPANASLCIAGDFQPAQVKRLVEKYFGTLPPGPKVARMKPWVPELKEEKRIRVTDRVGLARLYVAWPSTPQFAADDAELDILAHVLAGDKTSRLYRALVHKKQIAQEVHMMQHSSEIAGMLMLVITARPGHELAEVEAAAREEIARIQAEPPTADEIARAVNSLESRTIRSLEPMGDFGGRADQLNMYNVLAGDPGYLNDDFQRYLKVDPAAVERVARKYMGPGRVTVEVTAGREFSATPDVLAQAAAARAEMAHKIGPEPELPAEAAAPATLDRTVMPEPDSERGFTLPPIHRGRLSNGMEVLLVEKHELPLVNLIVVFPAGSSADPAAQPGLAAMTANVWDEGTARRSSEQIAADLGGIGATLSVHSDWDDTSARLFTLKRQLGPALDIYADVLRHPAFPQGELDRQRASSLARLTQIRDEPLALASLAVNQLLYGPAHPYGRLQFCNAKTLQGLTRDDLEQFYRAWMRPEQASLIAVGDVTLEELIGELEKVLAGWTSAAGEKAEANVPAPPVPASTSLVLVDKPGAAQSVVSVALPGACRNGPDYHRLAVMNAIFGGQFSSRLNLNLREDKGYTYGARTTFDWRVRQPGPFTATASVQTAVTAPALVEFLKEFAGMAGGRPVTAAELDFCRRYITRGYPALFETPSLVANQLETLLVYRLPDDFFNTLTPKISAVSGDEVQEVAKQYLKVGALTIIVVGDRKKIEAGLRALPVGKELKVMRFDDDFHLAPAE